MILEKQFSYKINAEDLTMFISIDYNGESIEEIINLSVVDYKTSESIDLTSIMNIYFTDQLDAMVESVNWHELYREKLLQTEN